MNKLLIIVDMQNDFVTGSLANKDAQAIVKPICDFIKVWDGDIICTRDTHNTNYMDTNEGKHLPVEHCVKGTSGWCVVDSIVREIDAKQQNRANVTKCYGTMDKFTFGSLNWDILKEWGYDEIVLVGTCTDICVISNALIIKAMYPETRIVVLPKLCAGVTKEKHEAALEVMRSCQIEVMDEYSGELEGEVEEYETI